MANEDIELIEQGVQAILAAAVEHESHNGCPDSESHVCWDNRYHLVAKVMHSLGCEIPDIGFIVEAFMDLEFEVASVPTNTAPEEEAFGSDDVIDVE